MTQTYAQRHLQITFVLLAIGICDQLSYIISTAHAIFSLNYDVAVT